MTDPKDELGKRFENRTPDARDAEDSSGSGSAGDTRDTSKTGDADVTRDRPQVPMYLPPDLRDELDALYDRLDARSKLAGDGGVAKHKGFFEPMVRFVLEREGEFEEWVGVENDG